MDSSSPEQDIAFEIDFSTHYSISEIRQGFRAY